MDGCGSGQVGSRSERMNRSEALDAGIRSTDGFAAHARVSTLRKGYIQDEFLQFMVPRHKTLPTHAPLIHIGTYHRSESIDRLVHDFLEAGGRSKKQVVSLGAGSDTRFWRLAVREN
jgi:[phosphatase 2A protein]-leucine-carboxy methyltransferase